jgi:hypothetical protein
MKQDILKMSDEEIKVLVKKLESEKTEVEDHLQTEIEKEGVQFDRKSLEKSIKAFPGAYSDLRDLLAALELFYNALPMSDHGKIQFARGKMSGAATIWSEI